MNEERRIDSKFRFVILAAKRAKQLLHGAKPRVKSRSKNPIRIAQEEVRDGAVDFEIVELKKEEIPEPAEEGFIGEEIGDVPEEVEEEESSKEEEIEEDKKPETPKAGKEKPKKKPKSQKKGKAEKK